ncbi:hypothetical protein HMPREF2896_10330 [Corynebacterium sp. HMSC069E04]|nr:hypothetical protein HMPREF2896_10330 [Corynebacterium sp. HMSC069E04]
MKRAFPLFGKALFSLPFHAKMVSIMMAPVKMPGTEKAAEVATGMMEVRRACLRMAWERVRPFARVVRPGIPIAEN